MSDMPEIEVIPPFIKIENDQWINVHDISAFSTESGLVIIHARRPINLSSMFVVDCKPERWYRALKKALGTEGPK